MNTVGPKKNFTADTSHGCSPAIWEDVRVLELLEKPEKGLHFYDDFQDFGLPGVQTTQIQLGRYKVFNTAAGQIQKVTTINSVELMGGALQANQDTAADSSSLAQAGPAYLMSGDKSTSGVIFFEAAVAVASIAANTQGFFVGLAEVDQMTLATGVPFSSGDTITNTWSGIGFHAKIAGTGTVDTVVTDRATAFTDLGVGEGGQLANFTFLKLGMIYDPAADAAKRVRFFANNLECNTKYTQTLLAATTNLKANALGLVWSNVCGSVGTASQFLRWWRVAQYYYDR